MKSAVSSWPAGPSPGTNGPAISPPSARGRSAPDCWQVPAAAMATRHPHPPPDLELNVRDTTRFTPPAPAAEPRGSLSSLFPDDGGTASAASELWSIVGKGWRLILFCAIAGIVAGFLVSLFAEAKYRAAVVLNVERDASRLFEVSSDSNGMTVYDPTFLTTQTRLMRSREVGERVITRLNLLGNPELGPPRSGFFRLFDRHPPGGTRDLSSAANRIQSAVTASTLPGTNLVE